jgi:hypothetical protein
MAEQHGFKIVVETIEFGTWENGHKSAMATADEIYDRLGGAGARVVVVETGESYLTASDGVFCEGCQDCIFPGIRWPSNVNGDDSREWVERCDKCERYDSDAEAAAALREHYPEDAIDEFGEARPAGCISMSPFVSVGGSPKVDRAALGEFVESLADGIDALVAGEIGEEVEDA